ncbi:hypothetical protein, partial [Wenyingzhuangia sp. 2_MG-2023]|uniref:hypothetical protein n=1 Tax=Wenyingzhuangia sp. 2_MG-2023 TaxID=3062639 RepID=UPI0026E3A48D
RLRLSPCSKRLCSFSSRTNPSQNRCSAFMKKIFTLILVTTIFISCKENEKSKLDFSNIKVSNSSSFRTHNFDNLKSVSFKKNGEILKNSILEIWKSERIFIGEQTNESNQISENNLVITLENASKGKNSIERISKIELIKNIVIENIDNINQFKNIIIEYSTETESGEIIESNKRFKIK